MGQTVYVLTSLLAEGNEWRPVAVVTDENVAEQWIKEGRDNDWIPFELDDVSTTVMSKGNVTPFKPKAPQPTTDAMREAMANIQQANTQLQELVEELTEQLQAERKKKKRGTAKNPLLQKQEIE